MTPTDLADVVGGEEHAHRRSTSGATRTDTALAADPLRVDAHSASGVVSNLNGVFETGETVQVETSWSNPGDTAYALAGNATSFDGPPGPTYAIPAGTADYGMVAALATSNCFDATGGCFQLQITGARPAPHWDATLGESVTLTPLVDGLPAPSHAWTLHVGESFPGRSDGQPLLRVRRGYLPPRRHGRLRRGAELLPRRSRAEEADGGVRPPGEGRAALRSASP